MQKINGFDKILTPPKIIYVVENKHSILVDLNTNYMNIPKFSATVRSRCGLPAVNETLGFFIFGGRQWES
jgi:hypothetical protein